MDNKSTTKRMIGAVVLVLIAALLLAWLLKGKNKSVQQQQELIADQTQDASPILGFPGVNKEGEQSAENAQLAEGQADQGDGAGYVLGNAAEQAADAAAGTAGAAQEQIADAGSTAVETVAGVASDAADAVEEGGEDITNKMLGKAEDGKAGLDVRDQRQIVENGEAKPGVGSMGGSEVATATDAATQDSGAADQAAEQNVADAGKAATDGAADASAGGSTGGAEQVAAAETEKKPVKIVNPKLVNETPVPAPRVQTAAASKKTNSDDNNTASRSASAASAARSTAGSSSAASSTAANANGYAIQVLAASSPNFAEKVRKSIAQDGYPTFVVKARVDGKTVYRVRVGTYPAQGAARAVQTRMKARYTKNQYVQNSFVTKN